MLKREQAEVSSQALAEADEESAMLRAAFEGRIDGEREAALRFKGENNVLRKKYATLSTSLEDGRVEILRRTSRMETLKTSIAALEKETALLRGVILEKDASIKVKDAQMGACFCEVLLPRQRARWHSLCGVPAASLSLLFPHNPPLSSRRSPFFGFFFN